MAAALIFAHSMVPIAGPGGLVLRGRSAVPRWASVEATRALAAAASAAAFDLDHSPKTRLGGLRAIEFAAMAAAVTIGGGLPFSCWRFSIAFLCAITAAVLEVARLLFFLLLFCLLLGLG